MQNVHGLSQRIRQNVEIGVRVKQRRTQSFSEMRGGGGQIILVIYELVVPRVVDEVDQSQVQLVEDDPVLLRLHRRIEIVLQSTGDAQHIPCKQRPFLDEALGKKRLSNLLSK